MSTELRTKGDIVNEALTKMAISGITAPPQVSDIATLIQRLEIMMYRLQGDNLELGYNFTQLPSPSDFHRMKFVAFDGISSLLAYNTLSDYSLPIPATLDRACSAAMSTLVGWDLKNKLQQVQYPRRMPIGSGNTVKLLRHRRYNPQQVPNPINDEDQLEIGYGEVNTFLQDYTDEFRFGEEILFIAVEASSALTYFEVSRTPLCIEFRLTAARSSENPIEWVEFTVTTTQGRVMIERTPVLLTGQPVN